MSLVLCVPQLIVLHDAGCVKQCHLGQSFGEGAQVHVHGGVPLRGHRRDLLPNKPVCQLALPGIWASHQANLKKALLMS